MTAEMPLSGRETAILRHMARGATNKEIASGLGITEAAVEARLRQLYRKLGIKDRSQVRIWAGNNGFR